MVPGEMNTIGPTESGSQMPAGETKDIGGFQKIFGVFTEPSRVFQSLARRPSWIIPVVILIAVAIVIGALTAPLRLQEAISKIEQNPRLSAQQQEQIIEGMKDRMNSPAMKLVSTVVGPIVGVFLVIVVVSAILYFGGNVLLGGDGAFKQILSIYSYSSLVSIPALIVKLPLMLVKKSLHVQTSFAALMPSGTDESIPFKILAHFDIFTIWQIALISIGLSAVYKFTVKRSASMVVGFWVLWIIVSVGFTALFGKRFMMM